MVSIVSIPPYKLYCNRLTKSICQVDATLAYWEPSVCSGRGGVKIIEVMLTWIVGYRGSVSTLRRIKGNFGRLADVFIISSASEIIDSISSTNLFLTFRRFRSQTTHF